MANLVKFAHGTLAQYAALTTKDENTLYVITDTRQVYKGSTPLGIDIIFSATDQTTTGAVTNTIYVNTDTNKMVYYKGNNVFETLNPGIVYSINDADRSDEVMLTSKGAVINYVADKLSTLDLSSVTGRIDALETEQENITDNLIPEAIQTSKDYADEKVQELADGGLKDLSDKVDNIEPQVGTIASTIATLGTQKADKSDSLAGYGILDAYTKSEADTAIASAVVSAGHLKKTIVADFADLSVDTMEVDTIYMVPKTDASGNQNYDEYMLINDKIEKIGDTAIDLTNYATKTEVTDGVQEAKNYADSLTPNYATAEQGNKADSALQVSSITTGTANGTIAVAGNDVAVAGLGTAAFDNSDNYDAAGSAAQALNDAKAYVEQLLTWQTI